MIDDDALTDCLHAIGLDDWPDVLLPMISARMSAEAHGDFEHWQDALRAMQLIQVDPSALRTALLTLAPWRKGPFDIAGVHVDSEWRGDLKWERVRNAIAPLHDRNVLDVGSGNGYYALQMRAAGAKNVIGVDPTVLFVMQFLAINRYAQTSNVFVLPLRLEELPLPAHRFDTVFSMGVLYHQRAPLDHLRQLRQTLRPEGQLVLETIYLPGDEAFARTPQHRYARMRNVWLLPSVAELVTWLQRTGYTDIAIIDQSITTTNEQRSTVWMSFESLREALDPDDPGLTIEGWPAPHRVVITATSP